MVPGCMGHIMNFCVMCRIILRNEQFHYIYTDNILHKKAVKVQNMKFFVKGFCDRMYLQDSFRKKLLRVYVQ